MAGSAGTGSSREDAQRIKLVVGKRTVAVVLCRVRDTACPDMHGTRPPKGVCMKHNY